MSTLGGVRPQHGLKSGRRALVAVVVLVGWLGAACAALGARPDPARTAVAAFDGALVACDVYADAVARGLAKPTKEAQNACAALTAIDERPR